VAANSYGRDGYGPMIVAKQKESFPARKERGKCEREKKTIVGQCRGGKGTDLTSRVFFRHIAKLWRASHKNSELSEIRKSEL